MKTGNKGNKGNWKVETSQLPLLQVLESRALYNLGNVYHAQGKHASLHASKYSRQQEEVDDFVRASLEQAARHYE